MSPCRGAPRQGLPILVFWSWGFNQGALPAMQRILSAFEARSPIERAVTLAMTGESLVIAFVAVELADRILRRWPRSVAQKSSLFRGFLKLKYAIPSHDTVLAGFQDGRPEGAR